MGLGCGGRAGGGPAWRRSSKELRIGYQPIPIQDASIAMFETWGAKNGIKIVKVPNSYGVYVEKMTASLTSSSDQYDVIWHNDDWGQLWAHLLEPTDDVEALKFADPWGMDRSCSTMRRGRTRSCRWATPSACSSTVPTWSSRKCPRRWPSWSTMSQKLQAEGKIKFGYVGGMSMNNSWFTWFWSMWGNNCDVLMPVFERDNKVLAENGWKSCLTSPA